MPPVLPQSAAKAIAELQSNGWKGGVPAETRDFFRRCYKRRYPTASDLEREMLMCKYLSCTMTRRRLGGVGSAGEANWKHGRMELSFVEPIPGTDPSLE